MMKKFHSSPKSMVNDLESASSGRVDQRQSASVATFAPNSYDTIATAARHLLRHGRLRLDLTELTHGERLRAVDFLCGILFATHGKVSVVNDHIYLMSV